MKQRFNTVTCLITWNGLLLLLKRSNKVRINQGLWCGVAGRIDDGMSPEETAYKEILEETGLREDEIKLISSASPISVDVDSQNEAFVYPFLFETHIPRIKLDWEHTEFMWVELKMVDKFETVPRFGDVMRALLPST